MGATGFIILGVSAYVFALVAPPLLALWCWNIAPRYVSRWLAHLAFGPLLLFAEWCTIRLLFFAAHDDGEGAPGLGFALIPAFLIILGTLGLYYFAIAWEGIGALWQAANDYLAKSRDPDSPDP